MEKIGEKDGRGGIEKKYRREGQEKRWKGRYRKKIEGEGQEENHRKEYVVCGSLCTKFICFFFGRLFWVIVYLFSPVFLSSLFTFCSCQSFLVLCVLSFLFFGAWFFVYFLFFSLVFGSLFTF